MANFFERMVTPPVASNKNESNNTIDQGRLPRHIAIIMDGNGRWARERGLPRTAGHRAGYERIRDAVSICLKLGIKHLTLYAFSTENWKRPPAEVNFLMKLFDEALHQEIAGLDARGVRVKFIGLRTNLSPVLLELMSGGEAQTANNQALTLNFALNYGGRPEIINACQKIITDVQQGRLQTEELTEALFSNYLFTAGQPDPDLLIKPGKERRISNFLIWQMAYTEFYFSDLYWPDFGEEAFMEALNYFGRRERRFGGLKRRGETD
jgi:undecaprenyl diphosphate synthase